jgi:hypothetical protein
VCDDDAPCDTGEDFAGSVSQRHLSHCKRLGWRYAELCNVGIAIFGSKEDFLRPVLLVVPVAPVAPVEPVAPDSCSIAPSLHTPKSKVPCAGASGPIRPPWYRHWRLVSLDGSTLDIADDPANGEAFGRPGSSRGRSAFPQIRFVALAELSLLAA